MHNAKALPFALLLSTPLVAPAHAQEADRATLPAVNVVGAQDDGYTTPDATSGTKTNAPLRDVPQTINVVPARVLEDQHVNSMQDALKNVPGVSFSHGDGQRDQVSIRGFSAIADQYVDGFRDDALYFRDLSNIERVDVIKGPAAVLYGRGSAGGLLMGAVANLGGDRFKAIEANVPFVDPLTSMLMPELPLTVPEWEEWGNPLADKDVYDYMAGYAPYENIEAKTYPNILALTSINDTRVLYVEPAKWIAQLRATATGGKFLLKTEMAAGHGGVSGRYESWRQTAFEYAWLINQATGKVE